jgi:hypothetical protein
MRLALAAAFVAVLAIFGCVAINSPDAPVETPATPSVEVPVTTPSVDVPAKVPAVKASTKHHKHRKHHHKHRHPAKQPEPAASAEPQTPDVGAGTSQKEQTMLSNLWHDFLSWLAGLSLANAVILGFIVWYSLKNGTSPVLSALGSVFGVVKTDVAAAVTGINTRVSALEADVAGLKAAAAPKAAAPVAPAAHAAAPAAHAAAPAAAEPAKA